MKDILTNFFLFFFYLFVRVFPFLTISFLFFKFYCLLSPDRVFDMTETTQDVYEEIAQPIVRAAVEGYDGMLLEIPQYNTTDNKLHK